MPNGDITLSLEELAALMNDEGAQETPPVENSSEQNEPPKEDGKKSNEPSETTKAFAKRLREATEKARKEERDKMATDLGYASYEEMTKAKEQQLLKDNGLDPEQVSPIVEKLLEERLSKDPRLKELEELKQKQMEDFAKKELSELNKLTGENYTSIDQLPKDVLDSWKQTGSLKKSYISLHGEELLLKARKETHKGSTEHLQNPAGKAPSPTNTRPLTDEEKAVWRLFNPKITEEELNKKFKEI